jgi:hypothetical protein
LQPDENDFASRVIDGPFPIGRGADDPLGYAYDATGPSRPYDPGRAFVLAALVEAGGAEAPATPRPPLTLAHPATLTATKACRRIAAYLRNVGLAVELRPAAADATPTSPEAADLTYVVVSATEPLVEAPRWFGPGGLVNIDSRALDAAVARLAQAESIAVARTALFEIQRVLHDEALVAPLWQLTEHAALRSRIVVPADVRPTALYQQVDRWQVLPQFSEALP